MSVVLAALLFLADVNDQAVLLVSPEGFAVRLTRACNRLQGAMLFCSIHNGMTPEQVTRLIGAPTYRSGGIGGIDDWYGNYGISVCYSPSRFTRDGKVTTGGTVVRVTYNFR